MVKGSSFKFGRIGVGGTDGAEIFTFTKILQNIRYIYAGLYTGGSTESPIFVVSN